jgi:hypothetical protein
VDAHLEGCGALAGAYVFTALKSRGLANTKFSALVRQVLIHDVTAELVWHGQLSGVEVWRGGLGGAYLLPTLSSE